MAVTTIEIKGIKRDESPIAAEQGTCQEMVNLRRRDGGLRPVLPKRINYSGDKGSWNIRNFYNHNSLPEGEYLVDSRSINEQGKVIGGLKHIRMAGSGVIQELQTLVTWYIGDDERFDYNLDIIWGEAENQLRSLCAIGDLVVVSLMNRTTYHLYRDGEYHINSSLSSLPDISLALKSSDNGKTMHTISTTYVAGYSTGVKNTYEEMVAEYHKILRDLEEEDKYVGGFIVVAAYRMNDGTTIKHSMPVYHPGDAGFRKPKYSHRPAMYREVEVSPPHLGPDRTVTFEISRPGEYEIKDLFIGKMNYRLEVSIPSGWEKVISGVDVYAARIPRYKIPTRPVLSIADMALDVPLSTDELELNDIEDQFRGVIFRKVGSASVGEEGYIMQEETISFRNLDAREALQTDQMTHHDLGFHSSFVYNSRVHAADTVTHLFPGHALSMNQMDWVNPEYIEILADLPSGVIEEGNVDIVSAIYSSFGQAGQPVFRVYVGTPQDQKIVYLEMPQDAKVLADNASAMYHLVLPKIITYPHPGATKFEVIIPVNEQAYAVMYSGSFSTHDTYSFAFHIVNPGEDQTHLCSVAHGVPPPPTGLTIGDNIIDLLLTFNAADLSEPSSYTWGYRPLSSSGSPTMKTWNRPAHQSLLTSFMEWINFSGGLSGVPVELASTPYEMAGGSLLQVRLRPTGGENLSVHVSSYTNGYMVWTHDGGSSPYTEGHPLFFRDSRIFQPNRMQLSEIENPFVWPALQSYLIGEDRNNTISEMNVQSAPTSEGQFGSYPLVVFAKNGIYLVNQGDGRAVYGAVIHISRQRARKGILAIDGAIVFTTADGLFVLQGRNVEPLNRYLFENTQYPIVPNGVPNTENPLGDMGSGKDYIQNCVFAYDNKYREIAICNPAYSFHYRYSLESNIMFASNDTLSGSMLRHGKYLGWREGAAAYEIVDMDVDNNDQTVEVYFKTNPLHLGFPGFKKLRRTICYMDARTPAGGYITFAIFGGNIENNEYEDGSFIPLQAGSVPAAKHPVHIVVGRTPASHRYYIAMMSGKVDKDSVFQYIETEAHTSFAKKIR